MQSLRSIFYLFLLIALVSCKSSGTTEDGKPKTQKKDNPVFPFKGKANTKIDYDIDKNGKKDLVAIYDERGHLQKLEIDTNENGKYDRFIFYAFNAKHGESRKTLEQYDDNEDGFLDAEKIFEDERMVEAWYDSDFNRKKDIWQKSDKYDKIVTKVDSDGDGTPDPGGDHIVEGNAKMEKNQFNEAYEEYKQALNFNSRSTMAYWGMAAALEAQHNYDMAIKHLERYILLKGPNKENATRKINYLKSKLKEEFRTKPEK
jgi:tetratricopeptide (TPR) repeat protein